MPPTPIATGGFKNPHEQGKVEPVLSSGSEPSETTLRINELFSAGQNAALAETAEAFTALFLAHNRQINNPSLEKLLSAEHLKDPNLQTQLARLKDEIPELYTPEGASLWLTGLEAAENPRLVEKSLLTGLVKLFLKGQMSAQLLKDLVPGGIRFQKTNPHHPKVKGIDEVAHFFRPDREGDARIVLYEALFGEKMVPEKALYHEIGHALLMHDGLLYEHGSFRTEASNTGEDSVNSAPPLARAEQIPLQTALTNPARQLPWETPFIAQLIEELSKPEGGSVALQKHIWEEMLAERIRLWFESDGSLGDFIRLRLSNSSGMEKLIRKDSGTPTETAKMAPLESAAKQLDALLTELSSSQRSDPSQREKLLSMVDAQADALGDLAEPLKAFLDESYHLHARYSRLLGRDRQAALRTTLNSRPLDLENYPFGPDWNRYEPQLFGQQLPIPAGGKQSFWQWLVKLFAELLSVFKI